MLNATSLRFGFGGFVIALTFLPARGLFYILTGR
jgi:hypothetical protein